MICAYVEGDRVDRSVSGRNLSLGQDVLAIVQTLEAEGRITACFSIQCNIHKGIVFEYLLQLELCTFQSLSVCTYLVHIHLVGEGDDKVFLGVFGILAGRTVLTHIRVGAVLQIGFVDIAKASEVRILIQDRVEEYLDGAVIQSRIGDLLAILAVPGKGQVEGMIVRFQLIVRCLLSIYIHIGDCAHGQAGLHRVMEGDVILHIISYIICEFCSQPVRNLIADIIVCRILPSGCLAGGVIGILDLLLEARLLGFCISQVAGKGAFLHVGREIDLSGGYVAVDPPQVGLTCRIILHIPDYSVVSSDGESDRSDRLAAGRYLGLGQHIFTIVNTLEAEGGSGAVHCIQRNLFETFVLIPLLKLELGAFQSLTGLLVDLVDFHLVGEGDDKVFVGLIRIFARVTLIIDVRVIAVFKVALIDVTHAADIRIFVEDRVEVYLNFGTVQAGVCDLLAVCAFPGKGQIEVLIILLVKIVVSYFLSIHQDLGDTVKGKTLLHRIMEGDVVLQIIRNVIRQNRGQSVRNLIADIIVRRILPVGGLSVAVVGVLDLLLEARLVGLRIHDVAGDLAAVRLDIQGNLSGDVVSVQILEDIVSGPWILSHPLEIVIRRDLELDRVNGLITCRNLGLCQDVIAVIQTLEGEDTVFCTEDFNHFRIFVLIDLLKLEFNITQSVPVLIDLSHNQLVSEGNDVIMRRLLGFFARNALGIHTRIAAVFQITFIDITIAAKHCILIQDRVEVNHYFTIIESCVCDLLLALSSFPGQGQVKAVVISAYGELITIFINRGTIHSYLFDLIEGQTLFHGIVEGNVILLIISYVVRQSSRQSVGDFITDIIVGGIHPSMGQSGGIIDIKDLLLEARLAGLFVLDLAGNLAKVDICRIEGEAAGRSVAAQALQDHKTSIPRIGGRPQELVICRHTELDRIHRPVSGRCLGLSQDVITIVKALEAEVRVTAGRLVQRDLFLRAISKFLLELEGCACQRVAILVDLVHIHLVGESDDYVVRRLLGLFAGHSLVIHVRIAAVHEISFVDITLAAKDGVLVEGRIEVYFNNCLVKSLICDLLSAVCSFPGQGQLELLIGFLIRRPCRNSFLFNLVSISIKHLDVGDLIVGQAGLHDVVEGDVVLLVIRYVVRQNSCQLVRHGIADVIVGGILPVTVLCIGRVVDIRDLLLEARLLILLILYSADKHRPGIVGSHCQRACDCIAGF